MADKRSIWIKRVQAWERSGQTRAQFCAARRLNVHTFDYWRRALRESSAALVPVVVAPTPATSPVEVVLANGIRLQVPAGSDLASLRSLIDVLHAC